jgi:tetratricopeptide (TPR) repeat protein
MKAGAVLLAIALGSTVLFLATFLLYHFASPNPYVQSLPNYLDVVTGLPQVVAWLLYGLNRSERLRNLVLPLGFRFLKIFLGLRRVIVPAPDLIGRREELGIVLGALSKKAEEPRCIYFSAMPGLGKSYFLNHLYLLRPARHCYILRIAAGEPLGSAAHRSLPFLRYTHQPFMTPQEVLVTLAEKLPSESLLLIDDFLGSDQAFMRDFLYLCEALGARKKGPVIVCSSRREPETGREHFRFFQFRGFSQGEIQELVKLRWSAAPQFKELLDNVDLIERATRGNVKLIEFLCGNPEAWRRLKAGPEDSLDGLDEITEFFASIWRENDDLRSEVETLAAMSEVADTFDEEICVRCFGPVSWPHLRSALMSRLLLESYPDQKVKFHNLLGHSLYTRTMTREERIASHRRIYTAYAQDRRKDTAWPCLQHAIRAEAVDSAIEIYGEFQSFFLRNFNLVQTAVALEQIAKLAGNRLAELVGLRQDLGHCYSMTGQYYKAYQTLTEILHSGNTDPVVRDRTRVQVAFVHHCQGDFLQAIQELEDLSTEEELSTNVRLEAYVLNAHCRAHLGAFQEAQKQFQRLLAQAESEPEVRANGWWGLAWVKRALGHADDSRQASEECLKIASPNQYYRPRGLGLWNLATLARLEGHFERAQNFCDEAFRYLDFYGIRSGVHILHERAEICRAEGDFMQARRFYEQAIDLGRHQIFDDDFCMHVTLGLAETRRCMGEFNAADYDPCIRYFQERSVLWAELSARIGKLIGQIFFERMPLNETCLQLAERAERVQMKSEIEILRNLRKDPGSNHLHPLFFM